MRAKYGLLSSASSGLALAGEVRLPTGREQDLLGTGKAGFSALVIGSSEHGVLGYHGNLSLSGGGLANEVAYRGAVCVSASDRVTLVGELIGRRYGEAGRITEIRVPHATIGNVDTIRLVSEDSSLSTASIVVGGKWNVTGTWILSGAHAAAGQRPGPALGRRDADRARLRVRAVRRARSRASSGADAIVQRSSAFRSSNVHSRAVNRGD